VVEGFGLPADDEADALERRLEQVKTGVSRSREDPHDDGRSHASEKLSRPE
jgi:hypothetical protein